MNPKSKHLKQMMGQFNMPMYGWWSDEYLRATGNDIIVYKTPSGEEVRVCIISHLHTNPDFNWPDRFCVGQVTDWVCSVPSTFWLYQTTIGASLTLKLSRSMPPIHRYAYLRRHTPFFSLKLR